MKKQTHLSIPIDHPTFAGHFPSTPIVPGVVLLDEAMHVIITDSSLAATAWQISAVKFLSPLQPGEAVVIEHEELANGTVRFEVWADSRQIVSGSLVPANK